MTPAVSRGQCVAPPAGLVSWFAGDGDASDRENRSDVSDMNAVSFVPGKVGFGFQLGAGGYMEFAQTNSLATQTLTIDVWVRPDGPGPNDDTGGNIIFAKNINALSGVQSTLSLAWRNIDSRFQFYAAAGNVLSLNTYPAGQFYHVAATYDGAAIKLYVNGILDNQTPFNDVLPYDSSVPYSIGATFSGFRSLGFARTWNGVIDELHYFNNALSAAEVAAIYQAGSNGVCLPDAPVITSPLTASATKDQQFFYQTVATDEPTSYDANNLPPGLTFDTTLGVISGVPNSVGNFQITLSATNDLGTGSAVLSLNVAAPPSSGPSIRSGSSVTGRTGQPFSFQVTTTGGSAATRLSVTGLPAGLTIDPQSGIISGIVTTDGSYNATLTVTDGNSAASDTLQLTFTSDNAVPVIVSPASGSLTSNQPFSYQINAPAAADDSDPTFFTLIGSLPPGLGFDSQAGTISGTFTGSIERSAISPHRIDLSGGIITNVQLFATNSRGTSTIPFIFYLAPSGAVNIATRLAVGTGDNVLIAGLIITGNAPKKVIIRAIGPSLPVPGTLQDPMLELHDASGLLGANDNWRDSQENEIIATTIAPTDDRESAILAIINPGNYTAIVRGKNDTTGIAVVEVYDLGTASLDASSNAKLAQISTRGTVLNDDNVMIGGFIISGHASKVIVRAIGPSLSGSVPGALSDTVLELRDGSGSLVASNDDWRSTQEQQIIDTTVPPKDDRESAIVATLAPGNYTGIVRGKNNATGVALVEVYGLQ